MTSWSKPQEMKSANCISQTGLIPSIAAPVAAPMISVLGQRRVEHPLGAELLGETVGDLEGAAEGADVLPQQKTLSSRRISSRRPSEIASR